LVATSYLEFPYLRLKLDSNFNVLDSITPGRLRQRSLVVDIFSLHGSPYSERLFELMVHIIVITCQPVDRITSDGAARSSSVSKLDRTSIDCDPSI
jgi:hypothetical protein